MKPISLPLTITLLAACSPLSFAQGDMTASPQDKQAAASAQPIDVPAAAAAAVTVVDAFSDALAKGDFRKVEALLDPSVVILEAGGAEHSRAEYLGGHARSDGAFLAGSHSTLTRRVARAEGRLVWVASERELHVTRDGKPSTLLSAETMLVRQTPVGWRIVHIHWSSKAKR